MTVMRNAEDAVLEFDFTLQVTRKPVDANCPDVKWNWIEARVFLVGGSDGEHNFRRWVGEGRSSRNVTWQSMRRFLQNPYQMPLLKRSVHQVPHGIKQITHADPYL